MRFVWCSILVVWCSVGAFAQDGSGSGKPPVDPPVPVPADPPKPGDPAPPTDPKSPLKPIEPKSGLTPPADPTKPGDGPLKPVDPKSGPTPPTPPTPPAPEPKVIEGPEAAVMVERYGEAKHWALKAIILLALGRDWHPDGARMIASALADRDARLRVYGLETLRRSSETTLRAAVDAELFGALVTRHLKDSNAEYRKAVMALLAQIVPTAGCRTEGEWLRWYTKTGKANYAPVAWKPPTKPPQQGSVEVTLVDRAFDVSQAGIELVIAIDTTGSMQPAIDATATAMRDVVALLGGMSARFRAGLVLYNDPQAKIDAPLDARAELIQERLGKARAEGGGDFPEAVAHGLELAFDVTEIGWQPTTHKFVLLVGDAPPHTKEYERALEATRKARGTPVEERGGPVLSGGQKKTKDPTRGVITSALAIGKPPYPDTASAFADIAKAGGGVYATFSPDGEQSGTGELVALVVRLSFGERFAPEATALTEIYQTWRSNGYIPR